MRKIETIWRELLYQSLEKGNRRFSQKELSLKFNFSTSTVFQSLKLLRKMGAVRVGGRGFVLEDPEKLLYLWASFRELKKDIIFSGSVNLPVLEIEGMMPSKAIFAGFSAAKYILEDTPSDYDRVYIYTSSLEEVKKRFLFEKALPAARLPAGQGRQGRENLVVLRADGFLAEYGSKTTLAQTFVDLWNLPLWFAKDYIKALKEKIDGLLP